MAIGGDVIVDRGLCSAAHILIFKGDTTHELFGFHSIDSRR